jgi:glycosyltransferase involved in cell wall biosynthesis
MKNKTLSSNLISIIIPNLNSPLIGEVINAVKKQENSYPSEIIVIGQDQWNILQNYADDIIFIKTEHPVGAAKARNIGIDQSRGNWLFFIDADCIPQKNWIKNLILRMQEGYDIVGGGVKSDESNMWPLVYNIAMFHEFFNTKREEIKNYLPTLNIAINREVINKVGFLNEDLVRCEDLEWTLRMTQSGYQLLFDPTATILHKPFNLSFERLRDVFYKDGFYSIQNRIKFKKLYKMPDIMRHALAWKLLSPVISAYTTLKIFMTTQEFRKNLLTIPYVYVVKILWCLGAAQGIKDMRSKEQL